MLWFRALSWLVEDWGHQKVGSALRWLWDEMMETEHQVRIFPLTQSLGKETVFQGRSCQHLLTWSELLPVGGRERPGSL